MTVQETDERVQQCDQRIAAEYEKMRLAAQNLGENAVRVSGSSAGNAWATAAAALALAALGALMIALGRTSGKSLFYYIGAACLLFAVCVPINAKDEKHSRMARAEKSRLPLERILEREKKI